MAKTGANKMNINRLINTQQLANAVLTTLASVIIVGVMTLSLIGWAL
jgi:hypothetical protein